MSLSKHIRLIERVHRTAHCLNEAVYDGNMGFEEMFKFYSEAPKHLVDKVEDLINKEQFKQAWSIVQAFIGIQLRGDEFK